MKLKGMVMSALIIAAVFAAFSAPAAADYTFDGLAVKTVAGGNGTVQGDVYVCYGDHAGLESAKTFPYLTNYSLPDGTVKWARLYVGIWGGTDASKGWVNTTFNGHCEGNVSLNSSEDTATYSSGTNVYGSGWGVWTVSYNCTDNVSMDATNTAEAKTGGNIDGRVYGIALVVVYENTSLPKVQYWINEGNLNLNYGVDDPDYAFNCDFSWFNGTAYNCTEANLTALYYTGSNGEHDYLYLNAPDASDSPYNLSNISWNIPGYRRYQLDSNDIANGNSGGVSTSAFDLDSFTSANDSTPLKDIINTTANNYAIFWRGHDDNGNGTIDGGFYSWSPEGEAYVHPVLAVLKLKDITRVYDFSSSTPGTAGVDLWAFKDEVSAKPPTSNGVPNTEFSSTEYGYIKTDNGVYQSDDSDSDGNYAAHRFNFSIDETAPEKINVTWNGNAYHYLWTGLGATLYIWNSTGYEQLDSTTDWQEVTLTGEVTSNIDNYINAGNVTVLVEQNSVHQSGCASNIETDYVKLVVTP